MRITSGMLNESARKSGAQINHTLLDYVKAGKKGNTLQQVLGANRSNIQNKTQKNNYEKLNKASDSLTDSLVEILDEGSSSLFGKLEAEDTKQNRDALYDSIETFVDSYNSTRKSLTMAQGTLNNYYAKLMKEAAQEDREELASVGISVGSNGELELEKSKLESADISTLKKVFGSDSVFMKKAATLAAHVSDSVKANLESLSNQYNASGTNYSARSSKYDTRR